MTHSTGRRALTTRYIDIRPRAPNAVFNLDTVGPGYVRLENIETKRTFIESSASFIRNYEPIGW